MKLIIQIPCFNERDQLPATIAALPRQIPGVDVIELLVIDDGSTDGTSDVATAAGVRHVVRLPRNQGLAAAYRAGLEACLRRGADVIVNTDADNQYSAADIPKLIAPILNQRADLVIGDRQTDQLPHFSAIKRWLQRWGSRLVRQVSGVDVRDAPCGFRALSRRAAMMQMVFNPFSYTLETILQAGEAGLVIVNVPITVNAQTRPSRLFHSLPHYLRRSLPALFHGYVLYWPSRFFGWIATALAIVSAVLFLRFGILYLRDPGYSGHTQSLVVASAGIVLSGIAIMLAVLADLLGMQRRMISEVVVRLRRIELSQRAALDAVVEPSLVDAATWAATTRLDEFVGTDLESLKVEVARHALPR